MREARTGEREGWFWMGRRDGDVEGRLDNCTCIYLPQGAWRNVNVIPHIHFWFRGRR